MPASISDVTIRRARLDDGAALSSLLRSIGWFGRMQGEPENETVRTVSRHLELCLGSASHSVHVAMARAETLVGYVCVHWLPYLMLAGPEGFVSELFVRDSVRGKGVGGRLLAVVEEEARGRGCSRLQLINFRQRESYQRGFYEKAGWEERPDGASFVRRLDG